jgi:hypothetical protein
MGEWACGRGQGREQHRRPRKPILPPIGHMSRTGPIRPLPPDAPHAYTPTCPFAHAPFRPHAHSPVRRLARPLRPRHACVNAGFLRIKRRRLA